MRYWLSNGDPQTYGPYEIADLQRFAAEGRVDQRTRLCPEGGTQWVPASSVLQPQGGAPPVFSGATSAMDGAPLFLNITVWRLIGMTIVSMGLYELYWAYRNWHYLRSRQGLHISPFWRAFFMLLFIYQLLKRIRNTASPVLRVPGHFSAGGMATGLIVTTILGRAIGRVPEAGATVIALLVTVSTVSFLVPAQLHINRLHEAMSPKPSPYPFSVGHIVCLVVGVVVWIFTIAGLVELSSSNRPGRF